MEIYDRIKLRREALSRSQIELAESLGYKSRSSIAKIEAGVNDLPQSKIKAFADASETTPAYLMGWTDDPYDYDTDPDNRMDAIPSAVFEHLSEIYDDNAAIWKAYLAMEDSSRHESRTMGTKRDLDDIPNGFIPMPEMKKIPLVGSIACGSPILAEENIEDYVDVPRHIRADYALTCEGDSMIGAGIRDGDIVYIRKQPMVETGQIAAIRIGGEATLKRFYREEDRVYLQAENPEHRPIVIVGEEINDITIEGLAVAYTHKLVK